MLTKNTLHLHFSLYVSDTLSFAQKTGDWGHPQIKLNVRSKCNITLSHLRRGRIFFINPENVFILQKYFIAEFSLSIYYSSPHHFQNRTTPILSFYGGQIVRFFFATQS